MEDLTDRQHQIFRYIVSTVDEKGYPPTVREICDAVGLRSPSTVHSHLAGLESKGYIRRDPAKGRAIEILHGWGSPRRNSEVFMVPLVGRVTAGTPVLAVENIEEMVPLPRQLARSGRDESFLLRVDGSSMIDAGIHDGDLVIVRRQQHADDGDIVVALVGDEDATVKRFFRESDHIRLQPENQAMEPIIARDVRILGRVMGLFRSIS